MEIVRFKVDDEVNLREYEQFLEDCPNTFIQQTSHWAKILTKCGEYEPIFLMVKHNGAAVGALPLYVFHGSLGSIITSTPEAGPLGGIVVHPGAEAEPIYAALLNATDIVARELNCLACTIITNPLASDIHFYRDYFCFDLSFENFTQIVDTQHLFPNGMWKLPHAPGQKDVIRNLRKSHRAGFTATLCNDQSEFEEWLAIHQRGHRHLGIEPLSSTMLNAIFEELCLQGLGFLQLIKLGDKIASGGLFVHHQQVCDAFMLSMDRNYSKMAPNYLLILEAMKTMQNRGLRFFNWQSSPNRDSGVYKFKEKWASVEREYYFVTKLYCDLDYILSAGLDKIRANYPKNFIVPFDVFETGKSQTIFRKP